ncbi:MAG TPA: hypothetical protein H9671_03070, partial [Firmicutes bacterium]|nr:hypothetical protein [Bacillota bacterium]
LDLGSIPGASPVKSDTSSEFSEVGYAFNEGALPVKSDVGFALNGGGISSNICIWSRLISASIIFYSFPSPLFSEYFSCFLSLFSLKYFSSML